VVNALVTSCPICSASNPLSIGETSGYRIARCRRCDHSFVENLPTAEQLDTIYERYSYETQTLEAFPAFLLPVIVEKVQSFEPHRRTGRLLDVGFGSGALLRSARDLGWKTHGIERSALAVEQARRNELGEIVLGDFVEAPFADEYFDVIVMSELIEHIPQPRSFFRAARRMLGHHGVLYMTTPHGRGVSGRVLKETWSVCAPPEHLHLFSRRSLHHALQDAGFGPVRIEARNVHPHELIQWAKRPFVRRDEGDFTSTERNEGSYRVNAALVGNRWGQLLKRAANRVLNLTSLGDGLVAYASARSPAR
jgi:2-polyprenyl-3-methyl-5-hydroxy-6-metoxy-1,4-benzoquinol methylase